MKTIEEFLSNCRVTDGAKIIFLYLIKQPGQTSTSVELAKQSGRSPASISRWTRQLAEGGFLIITYRGCQEAIYTAKPVLWSLIDK